MYGHTAGKLTLKPVLPKEASAGHKSGHSSLLKGCLLDGFVEDTYAVVCSQCIHCK